MNQPPPASISSRRAVWLCVWLLLWCAVFGPIQARASFTKPTFQTPEVIALSFAPQVLSEPRFKLEIHTGLFCGNDPVNRHDPLGLSDSPYGAYQQAQRHYNWLVEQNPSAADLAAAQAAMTVLPGDPRVTPTSAAQRILGALAGSLIGPSEADRALSPAQPLGSGFGHQASLYGSSFYNSTIGMISLGSDPSRLLTGRQSIGAQLINEQHLRSFTYGERSAADFNLFVGSFAAPWAAGKVSQMAEGTFGALRGFSLAGDGIAGQGMLRGSLFASEAGAIDILPGVIPKGISVGPAGHHVPGVRKSLGRLFEVARSDKTRPTIFSRSSNPALDHWRLHNAERPFVGPRQGPFLGTDDELFTAYRQAYQGLNDIRVDVRSPDATRLLGSDVSPLQAIDLIETWLRQQGLR